MLGFSCFKQIFLPVVLLGMHSSTRTEGQGILGMNPFGGNDAGGAGPLGNLAGDLGAAGGGAGGDISSLLEGLVGKKEKPKSTDGMISAIENLLSGFTGGLGGSGNAAGGLGSNAGGLGGGPPAGPVGLGNRPAMSGRNSQLGGRPSFGGRPNFVGGSPQPAGGLGGQPLGGAGAGVGVGIGTAGAGVRGLTPDGQDELQKIMKDLKMLKLRKLLKSIIVEPTTTEPAPAVAWNPDGPTAIWVPEPETVELPEYY